MNLLLLQNFPNLPSAHIHVPLMWLQIPSLCKGKVQLHFKRHLSPNCPSLQAENKFHNRKITSLWCCQ